MAAQALGEKRSYPLFYAFPIKLEPWNKKTHSLKSFCNSKKVRLISVALLEAELCEFLNPAKAKKVVAIGC